MILNINLPIHRACACWNRIFLFDDHRLVQMYVFGRRNRGRQPERVIFLHAAVCSVHVNILGASFMTECSSEEKPLDKA